MNHFNENDVFKFSTKTTLKRGTNPMAYEEVENDPEVVEIGRRKKKRAVIKKNQVFPFLKFQAIFPHRKFLPQQ